MQVTVACNPQDAARMADQIEHQLATRARSHGVDFRVTSRGFGTHKGSSFQYKTARRSGTFDVWLRTKEPIPPGDTRLCDFELTVTVMESSPRMPFGS